VDDIPLLVEYSIDRYAKKVGKKFRAISRRTLELFETYDWPGNVRELQNVVERAVVLCDGDTFSIDETWLRRTSRRPSGPEVALTATVVAHEKELIEAALAESNGRIAGPSGAAAKLGIPRQTLSQRSAASVSTSIASGRSKTHRTNSHIRLHCLSLLALRSQCEHDSVALISPDAADSSAFAEKSASSQSVISRLSSSYEWPARCF
jgi:Bacterial regulatory protein, Fis family